MVKKHTLVARGEAWKRLEQLIDDALDEHYDGSRLRIKVLQEIPPLYADKLYAMIVRKYVANGWKVEVEGRGDVDSRDRSGYVIFE